MTDQAGALPLNGKNMKLYMALNEAGLHGDTGLHARIAILSALRNTHHPINLLYVGERNEETRRLESFGVRVIDSKPTYQDLILKLTEEGRYWTASLGHWLRTSVCLEEADDEHVLYTDVDVVFLTETSAERYAPRVFCAAPEFQPTCWNYINAGVMVANVRRMRKDYPAFERYLTKNLSERTYGFHDQIAYNEFYRSEWERLPSSMNWKPYWGYSDQIQILHFHGPKIGAIDAIINGTWNWDNNHGLQIGSLFVANRSSYAHYLSRIHENAPGLDQADQDRIAGLCERVQRFQPAADLQARVDLGFLGYKMFPN